MHLAVAPSTSALATHPNKITMLQGDKDINGSSPPSSDLAMLADLAHSIANGTKLHLQGHENVSQKKIPLIDATADNHFVNTSETETTVKRDKKGNFRKLSIITTPPRRHSIEREDYLNATPFTAPGIDAGAPVIQFKTLYCKSGRNVIQFNWTVTYIPGINLLTPELTVILYLFHL
jgi:hypothetical protein